MCFSAFNISSQLTQYLIGVSGSSYIIREDFLIQQEAEVFMDESHTELLSVMDSHNLTFAQLIEALSYRYDVNYILVRLIGNIFIS